MIDLSPVKTLLNGKKIAVAGLGKSGMSVWHACKAAGIDTILWDDSEQRRAQAQAAAGAVMPLNDDNLSGCAFVSVTPGLRHDHPVFESARAAQAKIICDIELFHLAKPDARTIAITGTNGKSTTTALMHHVLRNTGLSVAMGGNIGQAVLGLENLNDDGIYVFELSSYQIELLDQYRPDLAVLLNVTPDHLAHHGTMENYVAAKEKIFGNAGTAVISLDDAYTAGIYDRVKKAGLRKMVPVSCLRPMPTGIFVSHDGILFDGGLKGVNLNTCPALRGAHNWQNAAMVYATARQIGIDPPIIARALQTFPGLAHRQNIVTAIDGVTYINDSKATNDDAASHALKTFQHIYWIAGGKSKGSGYDKSAQYFSHIRHAFLIGEAEEEMAAYLDSKNLPYTRCGNLTTATVAAHRLAQKEKLGKAVILLSPACASFDQYDSFEARGDAFVDLVKRLTKKSQERRLNRAGGA